MWHGHGGSLQSLTSGQEPSEGEEEEGKRQGPPSHCWAGPPELMPRSCPTGVPLLLQGLSLVRGEEDVCTGREKVLARAGEGCFSHSLRVLSEPAPCSPQGRSEMGAVSPWLRSPRTRPRAAGMGSSTAQHDAKMWTSPETLWAHPTVQPGHQICPQLSCCFNIIAHSGGPSRGHLLWDPAPPWVPGLGAGPELLPVEVWPDPFTDSFSSGPGAAPASPWLWEHLARKCSPVRLGHGTG